MEAASACTWSPDSFGETNYQIFRRGDTLSVVFRETYHADGPDFNNAYRTFTFDMVADGCSCRI